MQELDDAHQVALEIYRCNQRNELVYFSKLVATFKQSIVRKQLGMILDKLFDLCIVDAEWKTDSYGKWVRAIWVTEEYIPFFEELDAQIGDNK